MLIPKSLSAVFSSTKDIYYFGYGPIVNDVVRSRRGIELSQEQPAFLEDYRLTFNYGGVVNVVRQRGYEVHGIVMKVASEEDWAALCKFDSGYYDIDEVKVYPYSTPDHPLTAYVMVMTNYDETKLEAKIEKLPTERYLKLIATGMRTYNLDDDYIQDQIMAVPFMPGRKRDDWLRVPLPAWATTTSNNLPLTRVSFKQYQSLAKRSGPKDVLFILNNGVMKISCTDPGNPGFKWFLENAHGLGDSTLVLHKLIVDSDVPMVDTAEDLTTLHYEWAENHTVSFIEQCGLTIVREYILDDQNPTDDCNSQCTTQPWCRWLIHYCCSSSRLKSLQDECYSQQHPCQNSQSSSQRSLAGSEEMTLQQRQRPHDEDVVEDRVSQDSNSQEFLSAFFDDAMTVASSQASSVIVE